MFKFLTASYSLRYIDNLEAITETMNSRFHRSINRAPKDVTYENQHEVVDFILKSRKKEVKAKVNKDLQIGDNVRIALNKNSSSMDKAFLPNWSDEIYKIVKIIPGGDYPMYQLEDYQQKIIEGNFYSYELQKISKNADIYRIEKILKRRTRRGVKEVLVLWKNFGPEHASWIKETDVIGR